MNLPLFLARRINSDEDKSRKVSRPAIRIATVGVAIGLAVMIVSICVVLGFKHTVRNKVIGFGGHIQVANAQTHQTGEEQPVLMSDSLLRVLRLSKGIDHVQRYTYRQGILKTDDDFLGVVLKGVGQEFDTTFIASNLISGCVPAFSDKSSSNKLLISKFMADKLRLKTGDRLFAYFIDQNGVRPRRFTVCGIYQTNLTQYDQLICFTDLYTTVKLNGWDDKMVSGAELSVTDFNATDEIATRLAGHINGTTDLAGNVYSIATIRQLNPQIFSWLDLLDMNVWIILALMIAVAGVTIVSGLLIIILERTTMIGILKALGARNNTIRHTFLWFAAFIVGRGMLLGNILGFALVLIQKHTGVVHLDPQTYYVSTVPVEINLPLILLLNLATLLISIFVLVAPSYLISHIHPAKSMRYE
ncbi:MAG: ABC transporter permease [Prevotella sp.]|nr:ABC transporter permease [Prevotella sp.]